MDYGKKYLKYKSKYFELRQELINQGHDVDALMNEAMEKIQTNENVQTGGGDDIFISNAELSEMNLSDTPNVFDQEGGYAPNLAELDIGKRNLQAPKDASGKPIAPKNVFKSPVSSPVSSPIPPAPPLPGSVGPTGPTGPSGPSGPSAAPAPNPQKSTTTTTNVKNYYNYFDPLYPVSYTVPSYNTVVTTTPLYSVPVNTFPILKRNDDFFLDDDEPVRRRRSSKRSSKRRTSKRRTSRKSSKRKSSKRRTSRR